MNWRDRARIVIGGITAVLSGVILVVGARRGVSLPLLVLIGAYTLFFAGGAIPHVYNAVPGYKRYGLLVIGLVSVGVFLSGASDDIVIASIVVGIGVGVDTIRHLLANRSSA